MRKTDPPSQPYSRLQIERDVFSHLLRVSPFKWTSNQEIQATVASHPYCLIKSSTISTFSITQITLKNHVTGDDVAWGISLLSLSPILCWSKSNWMDISVVSLSPTDPDSFHFFFFFFLLREMNVWHSLFALAIQSLTSSSYENRARLSVCAWTKVPNR